MGAAALGQAREGGVAGYFERPGFVLDPAQSSGLGDALYLGEAFQEVIRGGQREVVAVLLGEAEGYGRVGYGEVGQGLGYSGPLRAGAPQERPTRRDIVEKPVHENSSPLRVRGSRYFGFGAAVHHYFSAGPVAGRGGHGER